MTRKHLFVVESLYLLGLGIVFVVWESAAFFRHAFHADLGALPIGVPWFGAVGATLISLTGIFKHSDDWDSRYALWHYARPLVGAFLGSMGALLFLVIVDTATTRSGPKTSAVFYVVAFLVGYREATFRSLIQRATDLLLAPSTAKGGD
jgi:hypothetical protein